MVAAGIMLAHQTASKAVREALFLSGPGVNRLPVMVIVTATVVISLVPVYARLLARYGPRVIVPLGFLTSAVLHLVEWRLPAGRAWVAVIVYLHVTGFASLLLSGFWSLVSELFDTNTAKTGFGKIAAAGTAGGLAGGGILLWVSQSRSLVLLAALHAACAAAIWVLANRATQSSLVNVSGPRLRLFDRNIMRRTPYLATVAVLVVLSTASAGIIDFLFKKGVHDWSNSREELQDFFALFYMAVGVLTFAAQTGVAPVIRTLGLGRAISALPVGLGTASVLTLISRSTFGFVAVTRGIEAVLRGSWFRSAYELLFVPMAPDEKRNTKTFLDVTCDRTGDALGAGIVQVVLMAFAGTAAAAADLRAGIMLTVVIGMTASSIWIARRIDRLYLGVVTDRLAGQAPKNMVQVQSETGWTLLELPPELRAARRPETSEPEPPPTVPDMDPRLRVLTDLRSGERPRVEAALRALKRPDRVEVAQVLPLLAWDELVPIVRLTLERVAGPHVGLLEDALRDRETDFAIRRRLPRILCNLASGRALDALVAGLDDPRFEVRYQCARAINRLRSRDATATVSRETIMNVIERELSVPLQLWQGHRLLDQPDADDEPTLEFEQSETGERNIEHIFSLLSMVLPREPLEAAFRALRSSDPELRALTLEYFEGVLPPPVLVRLWALPQFAGIARSSGETP
jgi:AAA family ATP:ADP antiporter